MHIYNDLAKRILLIDSEAESRAFMGRRDEYTKTMLKKRAELLRKICEVVDGSVENHPCEIRGDWDIVGNPLEDS